MARFSVGIPQARSQSNTISGTIAFAAGGTLPCYVDVNAYDAASGVLAGTGWTNPMQGYSYSVDNLPDGDYTIEFRPDRGCGTYAAEWWEDQQLGATATAVMVAAGSLAAVEPTLDPGGSIAGTIGFAAGCVKPSAVYVTIIRADNGSIAGEQRTEAALGWQYGSVGLPTGDYHVLFELYGGTCLPEWWEDSPDRGGSTAVSVVAPATTTVSPTLNLGGQIAVSLAFAAGGVLPGFVDITIHDADTDAAVRSVRLDNLTGWRFSFWNLPLGRYKVELRPNGGTYSPEWWDEKANSATASVVTIEPGSGQELSVTFKPGGFIAGTVGFAGAGDEPPLVRVIVSRAATGGIVDTVSTSPSRGWNYSVGVLPAGDYLVEFSPEGGAAGAQWWDDQPDRGTATVVRVDAMGTATVSPELDLGARISGTIGFVAGGIAPSSAYVNVYRAGAGTLAGQTYTDASLGWNFSVRGLRAGDYLVEFLPVAGTYGAQWWQDAGEKGVAAVVTVAKGSESTLEPTLDLARTTIFWQDHSTRALYAWHMEGVKRSSGEALVPGFAPAGWGFAGTGDFNGDGKTDILWRKRVSGDLSVWFMDGVTRIGESALTPSRRGTKWRIAAVRDFNGDDQPDILWRDGSTGAMDVWYMNGATRIAVAATSPERMYVGWNVAGTGDFNGDGKTDILWRKGNDGSLAVSYLDGVIRTGAARLTPRRVATDRKIVAVGDFSGDGKPDILLRKTGDGSLAVWYMDGVTRTGVSAPSPGRNASRWRVTGYDTSAPVRGQSFENCEACHDGSVAVAPNVMRYWSRSEAGPSGGHGSAPRDRSLREVVCIDCHDINDPAEPLSARHATGTYNSLWANDATRSTNTSHLKAAFFDATRVSPPPPVADGPWGIQVAFDNYCAYQCHADTTNWVTEVVVDMRHEQDTAATDANHWSVEIGTRLTIADGDALLENYPIDSDLNTAADGDGVDYATCVSCHDPHGTGTVETYRPTNSMVRDKFLLSSTLCSGCHL